MKHSLSFLLLFALLVACQPQQNIAAQTSGTASNSAGNLIQMEAFGCRGYCPVYKITFRTDGFLVYEGTRNVEILGPSTVRLSSEEYSKLLKEVTKVDLWQYSEDIQSPAVDAPVHKFTVYNDSKLHTVKGRGELPAPVLALEMLMQEIADAHKLPVRNGTDPNNPGSLKGQLIVKFKMDTNAREFCGQFSDLKVRPIRHMSEDNTWAVAYDPTEISQEELMGLLRDMDGVLTVEPNKQVNSRN